MAPEPQEPPSWRPADEDRYFDLVSLAHYSGMSVRTLHRHVADPVNPLPTHHVTTSGKGRGKLLVSKREFDAWVARFPPVRAVDPPKKATSAQDDAAAIVASIRRR
jgi:hypothetical protein